MWYNVNYKINKSCYIYSMHVSTNQLLTVKLN